MTVYTKLALATWMASMTLLAATLPAGAESVPVISWGIDNAQRAPQPNVIANRVGCGAALNECLARNTASRVAGSSLAARIALSFPSSRSAPDIASAIDAFVSREPTSQPPYEIGLDDFAATVKRAARSDTLASLGSIPDLLARAQPAPVLAITVYEDDLSYLEGQRGNDLTRFMAGVQRVAFFLHHRQAVSAYPSHLARVKRLFPNARIYGGIYHYDRIDYLSCSADKTSRCSDDDEFELFTDSVDTVLKAVRQGDLAGVELYPGRLGQEASWDGWSKPRVCRPSRRAECIAMSQRMGNALAQRLEQK